MNAPRSALLGLVLLVGTMPAQAIPVVTAQADFSLTQDPGDTPVTSSFTDTDTDSDSALASVDESGAAGNANAAATASGAGLISASADYLAAGGQQEIMASATASWADTINVLFDALYTFDFFIPGATLGITDYSAGPQELSAQFGVLISLDGVDVFTATALLEDVLTVDPLNPPPLIETGTDLGGTYFGGGSNFGYNFDPFNGSVDLGIFDAGDAFTLEYLITTTVIGPGTESGATASVGDPFAVTGTGTYGGGVTATEVALPVPATLVLFLAGFLALGLTRSHRRPA